MHVEVCDKVRIRGIIEWCECKCAGQHGGRVWRCVSAYHGTA